MQKILVTGAAGFIGYHLTRRLCAEGREVLGIDNLNDYYDVSLKDARLTQLKVFPNFRFEKAALEDSPRIARLVAEFKPDAIVNLAAQAGVRYSLENPQAYISSNLIGFTNILEAARHNSVKHLVFASSSSVYGANTKLPFSVSDNVDHPVSLYAATKKANELMAHSYAHLYGIPCTGLRFFTVYGSWGRPDMAYFKFTKAIFEGKPIQLFNHGDMKRDFTHIDDIVEGVARLIQIPAAADANWSGDAPDPATSSAPYRLYNIGNNSPAELMDMIAILERETGIEAKVEKLPMQPGDVYSTYADVAALSNATGFKPHTPLEKGLRDFVGWYRDYYKLGNGPAR
ncbi:MAG: capsular biosynthesis protein CpsI [Micavibrio aeruginosavorus]|uniref:Capsular biosynthesis protein CpsI n=1 Tax=Micavibrio aeruginosavorus TaxID=349221 RepID=A0A2W5PRV2_9BACT|nr:MAG: capsular biosynthesis protein CpsI [Micavibrio aeruginosavorus]